MYNEYREKYDEVYQNVAIDSDAIVNDDSLSNATRTRKIRDISKSSADVVAALDTTLFDDLATVHSMQRDDTNLKMLEDYRNRQRMAAQMILSVGVEVTVTPLTLLGCMSCQRNLTR